MTDDQFYGVLIKWASGVAGILFIQAYQNGTRPTGAYGTFNIITSANFGIDTVKQKASTGNLDVDQKVIGRRVDTVSVSIYRAKNGNELCNKLKASLRTGLVNRDVLDKANIGFVSASPVRGLTEIINSLWESRNQFDIVLNTVVVYNNKIESIESATVTGTFKNGEEVVKSVTINSET